jgi:hypothetical protein
VIANETNSTTVPDLRTSNGRISGLSLAAQSILPCVGERDHDGCYAAAELFADLLEDIREEIALKRELGL